MKYRTGLTLTTLNTQINKPLNKTNVKIDSALKSHLRAFINKYKFPIVAFYVKERTQRGLQHLHIHIYSTKDMYDHLVRYYNKEAITKEKYLNMNYLAKNKNHEDFNVEYIKGVQRAKKLYYMSNRHTRHNTLRKCKERAFESFENSIEHLKIRGVKKYTNIHKLNTNHTKPTKIKFKNNTIYLDRTINKVQVRTQKKLKYFKFIYPIINKTNKYYNKKLASVYCHRKLKELQKKVIEWLERLSISLSQYGYNDIKKVMIQLHIFYQKMDIEEFIDYLIKKPHPT